MNYLKLAILAGLAAAAAGCGQQSKPVGQDLAADSKSARATPGAHATQVTFSDLPISPKPEVTPEFLARGKVIYEQNCSACHGAKGDGKADAAAFLLPKPRNFIEARYRLRSTPTGNLPTDTDLFRAVSLGMTGTPTPPWKHMFGEDDRWALVEYVKTFSPRFSDPKEDRKTAVTLGTPPARNAATIAEGRTLYTKMSCNSCHGETGLGDGPSVASLVDDSGTKIKPRDFSRPGGFKCGYAAKEIVRTVLSGFDGTPMDANGVNGGPPWLLFPTLTVWCVHLGPEG